MRTARFLLVALLSPASLAVAAEPPAREMPLVIAGTHQGDPLWRDARAFDAAGEAQPALSAEARESLKLLLSRPADKSGCVRVDSANDAALGPHKQSFTGEGPKLARLFQASTLVLVGRVAGVSSGFADGIPATLAEIEPVEVLYAAKPLPAQRHFVVLPSAAFAVGGTRICKTSDLYPQPAVGLELLLFVSDFWGENDQVFRVSYVQVIPLPAKGSVHLPWALEAYGEHGPAAERKPILDYLRGAARERTAAAARNGSGAASTGL